MNHTTKQRLGPWLALFHTPQLSLRRRHQLLDYFGSVEAIINAPITELEGLGVGSAACDALAAFHAQGEASRIGQAVAQSLRWQKQTDCTIITHHDPEYPERLKQIAVPPLLLFVKGSSELLLQPQMAIVGSRNATPTGLETAKNFARQLARQGVVITSGLALGIDGAAHQGALLAGQPTIAVMATGADRIYPRRHDALARDIAVKGALVTEFPLGSLPRPAHFPQRNRVISGLCLGVLVVEAALKSGSLITARFAMEQGREVFALPGSIHSPQSKGCHELIRQGVKLVESIDDILEEVVPQLPATVLPESAHRTDATYTVTLDEETGHVLSQIGYEPTSIDLLVERTRLPVDRLNRALIRLELESQVEAVSGGYIRLGRGC